MILRFKIKTTSTQGIFEKIAIRVSNEVNIKLGLSRDNDFLYIYVEGDVEKIEEFSKKLSIDLPMSIFIDNLDAEVVEEFKDDLKRDFPKISLPPCPKCLREVKDRENKNYYNPFHHCEVCGYNTINQWKMENGKLLFEKLANKLKNEGKIYIQTMNGAYEVTTNLEDVEIVVASDLGSVAKFFMSFEGDDKALGSIEKPLIKLKTNLNFKKEFIGKNAYYVKLPDCMILELLFEEVKNEIKLLGLKKIENPTDFKFEVKNKYKPLKVVVANAKDILVYEGDRGLLPKYENFITNKFAGIYKEYISYGKEDKTIIDKDVDVSFEKKESKEVYAGFFGVLRQWELENKTIIGYTFYKNGENKILIYSPKFGLVEYIDFNFRFSSFEEIFALISSMNETGKKLIENFSKKREDLFNRALNLDISSNKNGIYYLWGIIGMLLGFGNNIDEGFNKLVENANDALTKKGPRIDYKMRDNSNLLNPLWAIRTAMSFHLAGVDDNLLSYGVIESFAEFLSNQYDILNRESSLDGAIIVGDLFEGVLLEKIYSYISKNYKVYIPKALSISGPIESFGSLVINAKVED
ncbi:hypothetical protein FE773_04160 [Caminibacter mediatlanticus TB-2]|uniref:Hydrogenase n=1 Tax=Caminibacter mediatlanticus TB-2 TaxID=391592 RepID=A0ABX5V844_9BACT|nr:hypothetical protein [Caminibacter mediatlanticus]QCT94396.1 hypothetical protein FE773_04160 [Caminibacter mediatlanticus TB-2]